MAFYARGVVGVVVCALGLGAAAAFAGDLNPPAGPIAPTPGPEARTAINAVNTPGDATSTFKITAPGSYYLTGNVTGAVGKHGILIAASGVAVDLNGFDLEGVPGMGAFDGVSVVPGAGSISIRNGSVRGWGDGGVDFAAIENTTITDVRARGNAGTGINSGFNSVMTACSAHSNGGTGISTGVGCEVSGCAAYLNGGNGFFLNTGNTITACAAYNNQLDGIDTGTGCTVTGCSACFNHNSGIRAGSGCTVAECTTYASTLDGIQVQSDCTVRHNNCRVAGNGGDGAGIHATSNDNRIEGNNCTDSDRGIDVDVAGNIIVKNTCSGNTTNWDVVAGNVILVVSATTAGAVVGSTGGAAPGSTDPNANFSY